MSNLIQIRYLVFAFLCAIAVQTLAAQAENDLLVQLRADYAALMDASAEFEHGVNTGSISGPEKADYGVWVQQLKDQFNQSCRTLSASSPQAVPVEIPCTEFTATYFKPVDIEIELETTDDERTAEITDQFYDSLGEFDEKLLTEQDRVKSQKPRVESQSASAGAAGGGDAGGESNGSDGGQGSESGAMSEENSSEESGQEQSQGNESAAGTNVPTGGARGNSSPAGNSNIPDDIPDGSDDDVIARQLREAAEKETDPELQKKLWEEYRRYKSGS
jgi:hypothetical protein